jgi:hypothetical protein
MKIIEEELIRDLPNKFWSKNEKILLNIDNSFLVQ